MSAQRAAYAPLDVAALIAIAVIWGVNNLLTKIAIDGLAPLLVLVLRFAIVATVLARYLKPPAGGWGTLLLVALLTGPLHFSIQYVGLAMAQDLSPMVIGMQLWIPASVICASLFLREHAGPWRIAGVGAAFCGIVVLAADPIVFDQLGALALVALASFTYGAGAVFVRRAPRLHPLSFQAWIALLSLPVLAAGTLAFERDHLAILRDASWIVWFAIVFAALASSVGANALMFHLVQRYEVSRTTPFLFLTPIISVTLGVVVLDDPLTAQFALGAVLTLVGVALTAMADRLARVVAR